MELFVTLVNGIQPSTVAKNSILGVNGMLDPTMASNEILLILDGIWPSVSNLCIVSHVWPMQGWFMIPEFYYLMFF